MICVCVAVVDVQQECHPCTFRRAFVGFLGGADVQLHSAAAHLHLLYGRRDRPFDCWHRAGFAIFSAVPLRARPRWLCVRLRGSTDRILEVA